MSSRLRLLSIINSLGRYLCDSIDEITDDDILTATSLEELKKKEDRIQQQRKLYSDFRAGRCYVDRRSYMCPRSYAQGACDDAVMDAFVCPKVFYIPSCSKFKTGECWKKFDELGFVIK